MGCASERIKGLCDGLSRCDVAFFNRTCAKFTLKVAYACGGSYEIFFVFILLLNDFMQRLFKQYFHKTRIGI